MREKIKYILLGFGVVMSAIVTVVSWVFDIQGKYPEYDWRLYVLYGFLGFFVLVVFNIILLYIQLNDKTPKIDLIDNPIFIDDVSMQHIYQGSIIQGTSCMAHAIWANNPKHRTENNSPDKVRAEISYLDEQGEKLFGPIQGRWIETDQPSELRTGEKKKIESTDFPNNGASRTLDLILKYPEDEYCYGYNNDSYGHYMFQNPKFAINEKHFFIAIELKGAYLPKKIWKLEVITNGKGDTFKIKKGDEWIEKTNSKASKTFLNKKSSPKKTSSKR